MQIIITCMECQAKDNVPNFFTLSLAKIPEDGVIEATCDRGHRSFTIIQQMKFEILSEMAIKAIVDGYYRDSISSLAGALERLFEVFIIVAWRKRNFASNDIAAAWKAMANLSERQLGAFVAAYILETGEAPVLLPRTQTELRNAIIHKGKFPSRDEAVRFGQAVVACARPILNLLKSNGYTSIVHALVGEQIRDRSKVACDLGLRAGTCCINTFLSLSSSEQQVDVEAAVAARAAYPDATQAVREANLFGTMIEAIRNGSS